MKKTIIAVLLGVGAVSAALAQQNSKLTEQGVSTTLDKMNAAGKSRTEIAQYVFDTHGCKSCHVAGQNGKLGFTNRGREIGKGFEGCVSMLSAMNLIAQVPAERRTTDQRKKAVVFQGFGCTFCHQVTPGKMGLTDVGAKLAYMHLGCIQVEQLVSAKKH